MIVSESACCPLASTGVHEKRRRVLTRRRKVRRLAGFVIASRRGRLGLALGDERVRLIGELGNGEQVDETEVLCGLPLAPLGVDPRTGDVVMGDPPTSFSQTVALTVPILSSATGFELLIAID